jgi:hypothetical protein
MTTIAPTLTRQPEAKTSAPATAATLPKSPLSKPSFVNPRPLRKDINKPADNAIAQAIIVFDGNFGHGRQMDIVRGFELWRSGEHSKMSLDDAREAAADIARRVKGAVGITKNATGSFRVWALDIHDIANAQADEPFPPGKPFDWNTVSFRGLQSEMRTFDGSGTARRLGELVPIPQPKETGDLLAAIDEMGREIQLGRAPWRDEIATKDSFRDGDTLSIQAFVTDALLFDRASGKLEFTSDPDRPRDSPWLDA